MAFPPGVTTAAVSLGIAGNFAGETADVEVTITPSVPYLIHAASGTRLLGTPIARKGRDEVTIPALPHTDQAGLTDGTDPVTDWRYIGRVVFTDRAGNRTRFGFAFKVPVGETSVDLDVAAQDPTPPVLPTVWGVTSVVGRTGAVTTHHVEDALHGEGWAKVIVADTPPLGEDDAVWVGPESAAHVEASLRGAGWAKVVVSDTEPPGEDGTVWIGPA